MPDITARGELQKPLDPEAADNDVLNFNFDKLSDFAVGDYLCTSLARYPNPWNGMRAFETDTKRRIIYDSALAEWVYVDRAPERTVITATGNYNIPTGAVRLIVECVGGGGGGGNAAATGATESSAGTGGGGGCYTRSELLVSALSSPVSVPVTVGAAGSGGNNGASTYFDTNKVTAAAGLKGSTRVANTATYSGADSGDGGTVGTGQFKVAGGGGGLCFTSGQLGMSGFGGTSFYSTGGKARYTTSSAQAYQGNAAGGYGGGGGGAINSGGVGAVTSGGQGSDGVVIVTAYFN